VRPGCGASAAELEAHLAARLARYKWPKAYVQVDGLPRTAYGKVQKPVLLQWYLARREGQAASAPGGGPRAETAEPGAAGAGPEPSQ
jgi:fatty-acyl-CoA synthase